MVALRLAYAARPAPADSRATSASEETRRNRMARRMTLGCARIHRAALKLP